MKLSTDIYRKFTSLWIIYFLLLLLGFSGALEARQFRSINRIGTPETFSENLPVGAIQAAEAKPLDRQMVNQLVRDTLSKWNTPAMSATLSNKFYDRSRLNDAMTSIVPRDATLRVQSVQGIQTLQQYIVPGSGGARGTLVSLISVTVRTQVEFNGASGFTRLPGVNEYILEVTTAEPLKIPAWLLQ